MGNNGRELSGGMLCLSADQLTATQTQAQIGHHDLFDSSAIGKSSFSFLCLLAGSKFEKVQLIDQKLAFVSLVCNLQSIHTSTNPSKPCIGRRPMHNSDEFVLV